MASAEARETSGESQALVTSIQHFCLHDGPGTRSVIFFKGCPLRCEWCHNPETWSRRPQHFFKAHLCIDCSRCVDACDRRALTTPGHRGEECALCFRCVDACPSAALTRVGQVFSQEELLEAIRPEIPFYRGSGGGVTLSGGEPTFAAPAFAIDLTSTLHEEGVHVALETCGFVGVDSETARKLQGWELISAVDLVLLDLKIFDPAAHRRHCGGDNERVKASLQTLAENARGRRGPPIWPRLPLVPGLTGDRDELMSWSRLLLEVDLPFVTLIPFHAMGASKRAWLGIPNGREIPPLTDEALQSARVSLESEGIQCFDPGDEAWELL